MNEDKTLRYSREQVLSFIHEISRYQKNLATIGHILRDQYLVLDLRQYCIKLKDHVSYGIDYELYSRMKNVIPVIKHLKKNHKDVPSKRASIKKIAGIRTWIKLNKQKGKLDPKFSWSPETNEKLVGKYAK